MSDTSPHYRQLAVAAAQTVAPLLTAGFRSLRHPGTLPERKSTAHDLVTETDRRVEAELTSFFKHHDPGCWIWGEETGREFSAGNPEGPEWIIDPIDGTSNFVHGFPQFTISIGCSLGGTVVAGAVFSPAENLMFSADASLAYLNEEPLTGRPSSGPARKFQRKNTADANLVTSFPASEFLNRSVAARSAGLEYFGELVNDFATVRRMVSGALELCYAAAGWADYVLGVDTKPWDVAAGQLILTRAGGSYLVPDRHFADDQPHLAPHYVGVGPGQDDARGQAMLARISEIYPE